MYGSLLHFIQPFPLRCAKAGRPGRGCLRRPRQDEGPEDSDEFKWGASQGLEGTQHMESEGGRGDNHDNLRVLRKPIVESDAENFRRPHDIKGMFSRGENLGYCGGGNEVKVHYDCLSVVEGDAVIGCPGDQIVNGALKWLIVRAGIVDACCEG